jgi:hypothetical protein
MQFAHNFLALFFFGLGAFTNVAAIFALLPSVLAMHLAFDISTFLAFALWATIFIIGPTILAPHIT